MTETPSALARLFANPEMQRIGLLPFLGVLSASALVGLGIAWLYRLFYGSRTTGSDIQRAFPLIALSVTAIFVCIQFSLPLSLGLLGALSIVRFRTPIKEPEEIGFILLVIASALACATMSFGLLLLLLGVAVVALLAREALAPVFRPHAGGVLLVSMPEAQYRDCADALLGVLEQGTRGRLEGITRNDGRVTISYRWRATDPRRIAELDARVQQLAAGCDTSFLAGGAP